MSETDTAEQLAEKVRDSWHGFGPRQAPGAAKALDELVARLSAAEQERDAAIAAVGEPCAECGHIDWRSDPNPLLERVEAAEQTLREIAAHEVMDETGAQPCDWHCSGGMVFAARAALAGREPQ